MKAQIHNFKALSGHADHSGLLRWAGAFTEKPRRIFVIHGEQTICEEFTDELNRKGYRACAPNFEAEYDLLADRMISEGIAPEKLHPEGARRHLSSAFSRLLAAGERLLRVIQHNKGGANKDLAKFTGQINSLCDKWDR